MEKALFYPFLMFIFAITMIGGWIPTIKLWSQETFRLVISFCAGILLGAGKVVSLLLFESSLIVLTGILTGTILLYLCLFILQPYLESNFSLYLPIQFLSSIELIYLGGILLGGITAGFIPAIKAYRNSLQDGLTIQV